ncbi:hypothetical protein LSTR_LSTR007459 [Laodelphax striatellus]|uniref:Receptor ligand binding region domain-containing protein n=1 Tax=Laodelphax striatellus TaxID=195883 RepID=A0A482X327_LAOST|nr:hypothetical protein LSTR_LSTR007459 [Laodelphax striatellus]
MHGNERVFDKRDINKDGYDDDTERSVEESSANTHGSTIKNYVKNINPYYLEKKLHDYDIGSNSVESLSYIPESIMKNHFKNAHPYFEPEYLADNEILPDKHVIHRRGTVLYINSELDENLEYEIKQGKVKTERGEDDVDIGIEIGEGTKLRHQRRRNNGKDRKQWKRIEEDGKEKNGMTKENFDLKIKNNVEKDWKIRSAYYYNDKIFQEVVDRNRGDSNAQDEFIQNLEAKFSDKNSEITDRDDSSNMESSVRLVSRKTKPLEKNEFNGERGGQINSLKLHKGFLDYLKPTPTDREMFEHFASVSHDSRGGDWRSNLNQENGNRVHKSGFKLKETYLPDSERRYSNERIKKDEAQNEAPMILEFTSDLVEDTKNEGHKSRNFKTETPLLLNSQGSFRYNKKEFEKKVNDEDGGFKTGELSMMNSKKGGFRTYDRKGSQEKVYNKDNSKILESDEQSINFFHHSAHEVHRENIGKEENTQEHSKMSLPHRKKVAQYGVAQNNGPDIQGVHQKHVKSQNNGSQVDGKFEKYHKIENDGPGMREKIDENERARNDGLKMQGNVDKILISRNNGLEVRGRVDKYEQNRRDDSEMRENFEQNFGLEMSDRYPINWGTPFHENKFRPRNLVAHKKPSKLEEGYLQDATFDFGTQFSHKTNDFKLKFLHETDSQDVFDHKGPPPPWPVKREAALEGDLILGGLMMVHEREETITCGPIMPEGGVQALEVMLYTIDVLNSRPDANFKLGAHILDDCDKDTYGLEMAVDFIKALLLAEGVAYALRLATPTTNHMPSRFVLPESSFLFFFSLRYIECVFSFLRCDVTWHHISREIPPEVRWKTFMAILLPKHRSNSASQTAPNRLA